MAFGGLPLRLSELWPVLVARLDTDTLAVVQGGPHRVYHVTAAIPAAEGAENAPWGRTVTVPAQTLWPSGSDAPNEPRDVAFLVRTDVNDYAGAGYDLATALEIAQERAREQLQGWTPPAMPHCRAVTPITRDTPPQTSPLYDADAGTWYLSARYRVLVASPEPVTLADGIDVTPLSLSLTAA